MEEYWQIILMILLYWPKPKKSWKKELYNFLKVIEKHNLCFKWSKCDFVAKEISILGGVVG